MKNAFLFTFLIVAVCLQAQQREDFHLNDEKKRIKQGIISGKITPNESRAIAVKTADYKRTRRKAVRDGVITPIERKKIAIKDAQLDRTIHRKKHN